MIHIPSFYAFSLFLALLALPFGFHGLKRRRDRGYSGCRVLGLMAATFMHGWIGRLGIPPWSMITLGLLFGLAALGWLIWLVRYRIAVFRWLRADGALLFGLEAAFAAVFLPCLWLVSHSPGLLGTEKLMDFAVMQSVAHSGNFPPGDPWFAGEPLNYYWFGHHSAALLAKTAAVPPQVGYNLMLSFLPAAIFQTSCGLFLAGRTSFPFALLGAAMVTLAGNLSPVFDLLTQHANFAFDLWKPSRIIPHTITEFPFFSFLTGDLHAHFLLLPSFILFLLWLLPDSGDDQGEPSSWIRIGVVNLLFLTAAMGNPWNVPVLVLVFIVFKLGTETKLPWWCLLPSALLFPFHWDVQGHSFAIGWVAARHTSPVGPFLLMWGMPLALFTLSLLCNRETRNAIKSRWYYFVFPLLFALHSPAASISISLAAALWLAAKKEKRAWYAMAVCGLLALAIPEFLYLSDGYPPADKRLNTVFKMHYTAWPLLMCATAYALMRLNASLRLVRPESGPAIMSFLLMPVFLYPAMAVGERTAAGHGPLTLDSFASLQAGHPEDMELIAWLDSVVRPEDVCLEMPGSSYSWAGRIAALTGCSAILGWEQHEMLWRPGEPGITLRAEEAREIYGNHNVAVRKRLIEKYDVAWIIVGELERQSFDFHGLSPWKEIYSRETGRGRWAVYARRDDPGPEPE
jgi:YYY domain-containing protein